MKRFIIPSPIGVLLILLSTVMCLMEVCSYRSVVIWKGNVTPSGMDPNASEPTVLFVYADGKKGSTTSASAVLAWAEHRLTYMWCDVARDGSAYCFPPKNLEKEK